MLSALSESHLLFNIASPILSVSRFHPLRYLQWSHSTPTLIYMIWLSSDPEEVQASQVCVGNQKSDCIDVLS